MLGESGVISNIRSRFNPTALLVVAVILLFLGIAVYYYLTYYSKGKNVSFMDNSTNVVVEEGVEADGDAELIMFHTDWCPHCKSAKPVWEKIVNKYDGKVVNGYNVTFTDVNCTEETPEANEMMELYKVEGFPTIKLVKGDQVIDFEAKPSESSLDQFLNTILS